LKLAAQGVVVCNALGTAQLFELLTLTQTGVSMGWWRIEGASGGINWSAQPGNSRDGATLVNYIPGKDSPENYYNGDEPADILDKVINTFIERLTTSEYRQAAKNAFLAVKENTDALDMIHKQSLELARQKIIRVYQREWRRDPYPEELQGLFEFCTGFIRQS